MTLAGDNAIRVLREECGIDDEVAAEVATRILSGEIERPLWTKDDGTLTIILIGEEGKELGRDSEDFVKLLELTLETIQEQGHMPDVEYNASNGVPEMKANIDFHRGDAVDTAAIAARAATMVQRLSDAELRALENACRLKLSL